MQLTLLSDISILITLWAMSLSVSSISAVVFSHLHLRAVWWYEQDGVDMEEGSWDRESMGRRIHNVRACLGYIKLGMSENYS